MEHRIGVDTGGTFTDIVTSDGEVVKVLSTPADPAAAVLAAVGLAAVGLAAVGLAAVGLDAVGLAAVGSGRRPAVMAHGTTVATNTLLERRGARVALYATDGHADVIEIARQARPSLYDPFVDRPEPLVPRHLRLDVVGRLDRDGREVEPLGQVAAPGPVDAAAVVLLHADRNPAHEQVVARRLRQAGMDVSVSSEVSPEFREYERTVTTVADAYLRPACRRYLLALAPAADEVLVMTSAGGLIPVAEAAERPVSLLLSGPAGGVLAAAIAARAAGFADAVTFDMGGTSTDVCLIRDGGPNRPPSAMSPAYRSACPHSTSTPSAPVAVRSPAWTRAGRWWSGPRAQAPIPAPPATGRAACCRPSPTPTWPPGVSRPTTTCPGSGASTSPLPAPRCRGRG